MNIYARFTDFISLRSTPSSLQKERIIRTVFFCTALFAVVVCLFILLFLLRDGWLIFEKAGMTSVIFGTSWTPTAAEPSYGIFSLIAGTVFVTIGAMCFAVPLSLGCAIYISELATPRIKSILKPVTELLAGIPDDYKRRPKKRASDETLGPG